MNDIQQHMQRFLERMVDEGRERGVQLAAYYDGELLVDAWAGIADCRTGRAVDETTLFPVFSTSKGIASTVLHLVVERLGVDYDMRIGELWPAFAANGKEQATIRHALSHTTGIPQMPEGVGLSDVADWDRMSDATARLAPQWPPGEHMEYHAVTFGWIIGEIAQRLDGRPFARIMQEDLCDPLGIRDLFIGLPEEADARVAFLEEPEYDPAMFPATGLQAIPAWICPLSDWMNSPAARRACVPASNGIMSAKAIAKHYASLLPGGVGGVELLPQSRMRLATESQDLPNGEPHYRALGYQLGSPGCIMGERASVFGHGGYGGSVGFADPDRRIAVGYVNNLYTGRGAGSDIIAELKQALGIAGH